MKIEIYLEGSGNFSSDDAKELARLKKKTEI